MIHRYQPRPPLRGFTPANHDHTRTMIFTLSESRCTACGATWRREPEGQGSDAAWVCVDPGRRL